MTVSSAHYGKWTTYTGTIAEVMAAVALENVSLERVTIFYNGTNITAVVYTK